MNGIDIKNLITKTGNINTGVLASRQDRFIVSELDVDDLIPSEDNFFPLTGIESLKENIEEFGLQQNLLVMRRPDAKYEIISGHRRREACRLLVQEGKKKFRWLPCRIMPELDTTTKNILLITMNTESRGKNMADTTEAIERLKILYTDYKKDHPEFKGRVRDIIADDIGVSPATVGRHEKISKNLIPEAKDAYKSGDMSFSAAEEMAGMSAADQKAVYEQTEGKPEAKDVRQHRQETQSMNIPGFEPAPETPKQKKQPPADIEHRIFAITATVALLETKKAEALALMQTDEESGNTGGAANRKALAQYLDHLQEIAEKDLEKLKNNVLSVSTK